MSIVCTSTWAGPPASTRTLFSHRWSTYKLMAELEQSAGARWTLRKRVVHRESLTAQEHCKVAASPLWPGHRFSGLERHKVYKPQYLFCCLTFA